MIQINTKNRQLHLDDLARVEEIMGRPLPEQYRAFLLRTNGGMPEPDTIDIEGAHFHATDVQVLYGIDTVFESSGIFWSLELFEGCKENHLLPIAHDSGGHRFILVLADDDEYGHVYYFDSAESPPRPYHVADSFDEFLGKLREPTPYELGETDELVESQ